MNEVAKVEPNQIQHKRGIKGLIPVDFKEAFLLAENISKAGLSPKGMSTPDQCFVAIVAGMEIGLPPMQAVQSIAVINGRPCLWGDAVMAIVRQSGLAEYIEETIEGEGDQMVAICRTHRIGDPNPIERRFSVDDAITAEKWGVGVWKSYPQRMLKMRARSWCLRDAYPDALKGMAVREEVSDYEEAGSNQRQVASEANERYSKPSENNKFNADSVIEAVTESQKTENNELPNDKSASESLVNERSASEQPTPRGNNKTDAEMSQEDAVKKVDVVESQIHLLAGQLLLVVNRGDMSFVSVNLQIEDDYKEWLSKTKDWGIHNEAAESSEKIHHIALKYCEHIKDSQKGLSFKSAVSETAKLLEVEEEHILDEFTESHPPALIQAGSGE